MSNPKKRVLLKLSGEAFAPKASFGLCGKHIKRVVSELIAAHQNGIEIAVVVGAGNFIRGASIKEHDIDPIMGDQMGMMATVINGLALFDILNQAGIPAVVYGAKAINGVVLPFHHANARADLSAGKIVICVGGTGNPLVTTDTAASLRGVELGVDMLLKATQVDGVYDCDPKQNSNAHFYDHISFDTVLAKQLKVMDLAAFDICSKHQLPIRVFNLHQDGQLKKALLGETIGTLIGE